MTQKERPVKKHNAVRRFIFVGLFILVLILLVGFSLIGFERRMVGPLYEDVEKSSNLNPKALPRAATVEEQVPLKLVWKHDARQMYAYRLKGDMELRPLAITTNQPVGTKRPMKVVVNGTLNMRVLRVDEMISVAFQLSPARVELNGVESASLSRMYGYVFVALFSPYGEVLHYITPQVLTQKETQSLSGIVASLQLVIPPEEYREDPMSWRSKEIDMAGSYVAQYVGSDSGVILKEKLQYMEMGQKPGGDDAVEEKNEAAQMFSAAIKGSLCQIGISRGVSWITEYSGQDHVEISANGSVFNESLTDLELRSIPFEPDPYLEIWSLVGSYENMLQQVVMSGFHTRGGPAGDAWEEERLRALREKYQTILVPDLYQQMWSAVDLAESHVDTIGAIHSLRDCLIAYPERALGIPELLIEEPVPDEVAGRIIHAMELAGTPEAQTALGEIMVNSQQQRNQRLQAVVASGGVEVPVDAMVDSLQAMRGDDTVDQTMQNCSLLALGSIGGSYGKMGNVDGKEALEMELVQVLQEEQGAEAEVALLALANAGGVSVDIVTPWLMSENDMVRGAACGALLVSEDAEGPLDLLRGMMVEDDSSVVRKAAFEALEQHDDPAAVAALARERLLTEDDALLRSRLVACLASEGSAESRAVLQEQLKVEADDGVKKNIYRALYTSPAPAN